MIEKILEIHWEELTRIEYNDKLSRIAKNYLKQDVTRKAERAIKIIRNKREEGIEFYI